jgi:dipeptidyl aminopeptidase/acylaminoacyl peptidase
MKKALSFLIFFGMLLSAHAQQFDIAQISSFPFPSELSVSATGQLMAWAVNEKGQRNIYVAEGPVFQAKRMTSFLEDDGQEITSLQFSPDGKWLVFVRGGEHGSNWNTEAGINPSQLSLIPKVQIWKVPIGGGEASILVDGDDPVVSPDNATVAYLKGNQVYTTSISEGNGSQLFEVKGNVGNLQWSPDGKQLMCTVNRATHSMIGIFDMGQKSFSWIAPSFSRDTSPRWSREGKKIAFVRLPGGKGASKPLLEQRHSPWEIWIADPATGQAKQRWKAPETLRGSVPTTHGGFNLSWAAEDQLVYTSYEDGWPHLYAMNATSGPSKLLTPGNFMVEHVRLSPDGKFAVFSANTGNDPLDIDRRHIGKVTIKDAKMEVLTPGTGIEAIPVVFPDNQTLAFFSSTTSRPLLPAVLLPKAKSLKLVGENLIPSDFPKSLVTPKQVTFKSPDGVTVYGQLFEKEGAKGKKPAVLFVHGGPQRQMLLGWHYGDYYSNTYAINQYLAEAGFVVLAVNFRLGIGYGYEFHKPARTYWQGAEEYLDVKAAGEFLQKLPQVEPSRIGIYGGSYGGYLTALALGKDSDLFKVGVDIHGVHDLSGRFEMPEGYEKAPDYEEAVKTAWYSSPLAYLDQWTSPVLFIHGDDDRNVQVAHTADIIRRFEEKQKPYDYLMIPDDSHHWMKFGNLVKVNAATVEYLKRHLKP